MTEFLQDYGLALLFAILALQAAGVGGLPGKTSLVAAALLAADGHFAIVEVIAVAAVAVLLGGYVGYGIGRKGGRPLLERTGLASRLRRPLELFDRFFAEHGGKTVVLARFLPGLKVVAAPAAGVAGMRWWPFAAWHALAAVGFAVVFGLAGYYLGRGAIELIERFGTIAIAPLAALVLIWIAFVMRRRRRASPSV